MDIHKINIKKTQFFSIDLDIDNLKFIHSGCWNTECKNRINLTKLKHQYINTALYDQLHITTQINSEKDIQFLSLIGDNIYQKYYEPPDMTPGVILHKIPDGLACIKQFILLGLGNHDVSDKETYDKVMELKSNENIFIPNDYYCLIINMRDFNIKLIYINTNILNDYAETEPYYRTIPEAEYIKMQQNQYEFLNEAINSGEFTTKYTIVLGHEPIIYAPHSEKLLEETTKSEFLRINELINNGNVDFYLNADEHNLQSISSNRSKLKYIISGGGGALSDFPIGLYNKKLEDADFILQNDKYIFNEVIASHGYVKFDIQKDSINYYYIVPEYVNNDLNNKISVLDESIFSVPFKIIIPNTVKPTSLYISPKLVEEKKGGYYDKYLKYKNKYVKLKNSM